MPCDSSSLFTNPARSINDLSSRPLIKKAPHSDRDISGKDFSWDVQELVETTIKLNLVFDNPLEVSQEKADLLVIEFDASESFEIAEKVIFIQPIPKLLPNSDFSKNVVESTSNAAQLSAGATATTALT